VNGRAEFVTEAGLEFRVDVRANGTVMILRDGREVHQVVTRVTTRDIVPEAILLHRVDGQVYRVVDVNDPIYTIKRDRDGSLHEASLLLLKQHFWLVTTSPVHGVG
jgi:hypothetical protein